MASNWQKANVGVSGRRRLVPMMGIDFIAGNIERKQPEYGAGGKKAGRGSRPACIGGRTRSWTNVNFFQVTASGPRRTTATKSSEIAQRLRFATAAQSAAATVKNPGVLAALQADWRLGSTRYRIDSKNYPTMRGWVTAVRLSQIADGVDIQPTTDTWPPQDPT